MSDSTMDRDLGCVAALAGARWVNEGYDLESVEDWAPLTASTYQTGEFTPSLLTASGEGPTAKWSLEDQRFSERTIEVFYDPDAVHLAFEGKGDGVRGGGLAELDTNQARALAAALFQAAEELDRRREATDVDE